MESKNSTLLLPAEFAESQKRLKEIRERDKFTVVHKLPFTLAVEGHLALRTMGEETLHDYLKRTSNKN